MAAPGEDELKMPFVVVRFGGKIRKLTKKCFQTYFQTYN